MRASTPSSGISDTGEQEALTPDELVELCAIDNNLFVNTFFSRTVRQPSPSFHDTIWRLAESHDRLVNIQVFRDGAKTSLLRMYTAKRIAYGLAHTILYIGKSEPHAIRSGKWIRAQIEHNTPFRTMFGLAKGRKWQDIEFEILHKTDDYPITVICMGITGSTRGINIDDYRPDLIIIDDVIDPENASTPEQRTKIRDLILADLKHSLAPRSEMPDAKLVMLQTPLDREDASCLALTDLEWKSAVFGVWTEATKDLPVGLQESRWPERYPSEDLRKEKQAAIQNNTLYLWLKEKECKLISPETCAFKPEWLQYYDTDPEYSRNVIVIDPVPPPSERQIARGLRGKDFEAFAVVGKYKGNFFLREYRQNRGHDPDWTIAVFLELAIRWRPICVVVEAVAYQRTLSWLLRKAMQHHRRYFVIKDFVDKRSKYDRIVQGLRGPAANGKVFVKNSHSDFISQFRSYPNTSHEDLLEAVAIGVAELQETQYGIDDDFGGGDYIEDQRNIPLLQHQVGSP